MRKAALHALAVAGLAVIAGCKRDLSADGGRSSPASPAGRERTPSQTTRLEELVMIQQEGGGTFAAREIHVEPVRRDDFQLLVRGLATSHTVEANKLLITSEALFVRVNLLLLNDAKTERPIDLRTARLTVQGEAFSLARHAQLAEPRTLRLLLGSGDRQERTLYFELPEPGVGAGLTLLLPAGAVDPAEIKIGLL